MTQPETTIRKAKGRTADQVGDPDLDHPILQP